MVYEKDKIRRLIEYKDKITQSQIKNDLEWIVARYNEYFVNSKDYEYQKKEYKTILNKYYVSEDEKASLKEELCLIRRKYKVLKQSCEKSKDVI
ncbi:MAG: hypothetical protein U0L22_04490 [Bacteroidales bacterium]|nr:hypothetical protein [Bacteroidales bacterium]